MPCSWVEAWGSRDRRHTSTQCMHKRMCAHTETHIKMERKQGQNSARFTKTVIQSLGESCCAQEMKYWKLQIPTQKSLLFIHSILKNWQGRVFFWLYYLSQLVSVLKEWLVRVKAGEGRLVRELNNSNQNIKGSCSTNSDDGIEDSLFLEDCNGVNSLGLGIW